MASFALADSGSPAPPVGDAGPTLVMKVPALPALDGESSLRLCKLPASVSFAEQGFRPDTYSETAELQDMPAGTTSVALAAGVIRWRFKRGPDGAVVRDADGAPVRESNTRVVQWENGLFSLHIGETAFLLNVEEDRGLRSYAFVEQRALTTDAASPAAASDAADAAAAPARSEVLLEDLAPLTHRVSMRVTDSGRVLTQSTVIAQRVKAARERKHIELGAIMEDPAAQKLERVKERERMIRQQEVERQKAGERERRDRARGTTGGLRRRGTIERSASFGASGVQYEDSDLAALKRQGRVQATRHRDIDDEDEDEADDEDEYEAEEEAEEEAEDEAEEGEDLDVGRDERRRGSRAHKAARDGDGGEEDEEEDDDEDEGEDEPRESRKRKAKGKATEKGKGKARAGKRLRRRDEDGDGGGDDDDDDVDAELARLARQQLSDSD